MLIGYVDCDWVAAVALVVVSTGFIGVSSAAILGVNQLDLSPKYAGARSRDRRHLSASSFVWLLSVAHRAAAVLLAGRSSRAMLASARVSCVFTSHHMENTEAGLQRPPFLRNRLKTTSI